MNNADFDASVKQILKYEDRYQAPAYAFMREAVKFVQKEKVRSNRLQGFHVSITELLAGIRLFALQQYGPFTKGVLEKWGVTTCEDFGRIVFLMIDHGLLGASEHDRLEDFKDGYDFDDAFVAPFMPEGKELKLPVLQ